ncbi:ubiquitin-conjugating enzyme [Purpureocillium lavendulum]|uniref:Ubiquitin-conjugating enzyme n=1 Tax=Purpureocillium lavendulum TaxID=1247861 RepID=A0AB34FLV5_9HYPO|nr:ubiquitin-conjugating enzyme [Purpureocillium lavendulum]
MKLLGACCLALLAASASARSSERRSLRNCVAGVFGKGADARIVSPEDETYTDARIGESIQFNQLPLLIAYADDASQVAPLISCAKKAGVKAVPRTGGHHFMAYSALTGTLVIDMTHVDRVRVSADKSMATVGAGIRLGALYTALSQHGRDWPGGICPTVGLSGFLGAGGFNMQMRQLGMGVDHVLAARVVLADGRAVTASPRENRDLFWAVRGGGGGSYGVVVEWTLRLARFPRSAMVQVKWEGAALRADLAARFFAWAPRTDRRFTSSVNVYKNRTEVLGWCLGCRRDEARALMDESGLLAVGAPEVHIAGGCSTDNARMFGYVVSDCLPDADVAKLAPLAMNVVQQPFTPVDGNHTQFRWRETPQNPGAPAAQPWPRFRRISKSFFVTKDRQLTRAAVQQLVDRLSELPDEVAGWGEWHAWNISGPSDQAAFPWREQAYAHLEFILTGSADEQKQKSYLKWAASLESFLRPMTGPASYAGYMDANISTDALQSYYGPNVARLSAVKRKYDRSAFFDNPLSIQST